MRHYHYKRPAASPLCCATLKHKQTQCSNKGIYVNGIYSYCGVHLHKLDREIEVYDLVVDDAGGYKTNIVNPCTTLQKQTLLEEQCSICMESIDTNMGVRTQCGHSFHIRCLHVWNISLNHNTCPNCREPIRSTKENNNHLYSILDLIDDQQRRMTLLHTLNNDDVHRVSVRIFEYNNALDILEYDILPFI